MSEVTEPAQYSDSVNGVDPDLRVLILGGTAEARELAIALVGQGIAVVSSLAGRVSRPRLPVGEVRIGGFGGIDGLTAYLRQAGITHVVDATHPFAVGMRTNACAATGALGIPMVRLARPGWREHPDAESWSWVESYDDADVLAARLGTRPFITSGRQTLAFYQHLRGLSALIRVVEPLEQSEYPSNWTVVLDRGPFTREQELALMSEYSVDVLITKDSGGAYTAAKLDAARVMGIPVVVVARPASPAGLAECTTVADVVVWLSSAAGST